MARIDQIRKLLQASPEDVFLNYSLGMECQAAGQAAEALAQFERTLARDAGYLAAYVQKSQALVALGRIDEARATLTTAAGVARAAGNTHELDNINQMLARFT